MNTTYPYDNLPLSSPTRALYMALDIAYEVLNERLFGGQLPLVRFDLSMTAGRLPGKIVPAAIVHRSGQIASVITLNSGLFAKRSPQETLLELVHQMLLQKQHLDGTAGRLGYHNRQFVYLADKRGITVTGVGRSAGRETGQRVALKWIKGGPFDLACAQLLKPDANGKVVFDLEWLDRFADPSPAGSHEFTSTDFSEDASSHQAMSALSTFSDAAKQQISERPSSEPREKFECPVLDCPKRLSKGVPGCAPRRLG